jgi:hypothetical protein
LRSAISACAEKSGNEIEISGEGYANLPYKKNQIVKSIVSFLEIFSDSEEIEELVKQLDENEEKILENIKSFEINNSESGWQGDSEARYYTGKYDSETLKKYYKEIAEKLGCSVEEVTEEDFQEFVADKISIDEVNVVYNPETGELEQTKSFYLEY